MRASVLCDMELQDLESTVRPKDLTERIQEPEGDLMTTTATHTTTTPELLVAYTSLLPAVIIPIRAAPAAHFADDDLSLDVTVDDSEVAPPQDELEF